MHILSDNEKGNNRSCSLPFAFLWYKTNLLYIITCFNDYINKA